MSTNEKPPEQTTEEFRPPLPQKEPPDHQYWVDQSFWFSYVASRDAAVASERARCATIVRRFRLDEHADIMLQEIENG